MRLLFDQNLSHSLPQRLADLYPDSLHLRHAGLLGTDDLVIWQYAGTHGLAIVSKDSDFNELAFRLGSPPKVIWLRMGNCSTTQVEAALRTHHADLLTFEQDAERHVLELF
jgi:predicted nuclease of predicted toxin-antitoxin system